MTVTFVPKRILTTGVSILAFALWSSAALATDDEDSTGDDGSQISIAVADPVTNDTGTFDSEVTDSDGTGGDPVVTDTSGPDDLLPIDGVPDPIDCAPCDTDIGLDDLFVAGVGDPLEVDEGTNPEFYYMVDGMVEAPVESAPFDVRRTVRVAPMMEAQPWRGNAIVLPDQCSFGGAGLAGLCLLGK